MAGIFFEFGVPYPALNFVFDLSSLLFGSAKLGSHQISGSLAIDQNSASIKFVSFFVHVHLQRVKLSSHEL